MRYKTSKTANITRTTPPIPAPIAVNESVSGVLCALSDLLSLFSEFVHCDEI